MGADLTFLDELILGLDYNTLHWAKLRIEQRMASMKPEIIVRRIIIRKKEE